MLQALSEVNIQFIKGIGPHRAKLLKRLGIETTKDALLYLPCRYEDRRKIKKLSELHPDQRETVNGIVQSADLIRTRRKGVSILELTIYDGTGTLKVKWFNQPFMKKQFRKGDMVILNGTVKLNPYRGVSYEMTNPDFEIISKEKDNFLHTARTVPVYRTTQGLSVKVLRGIIFTILDDALQRLKDPVSRDILTKHGLRGLRESIRNVHFPDSECALEALNSGVTEYHRRLSFDELFYLELGLTLLKRNRSLEKGISFQRDGILVQLLTGALPFSLTNAQKRVFEEILTDMKLPHPMNRLIQGDVGSGKTIVALLAMLTAIDNGYQTTIMTPTEILAEQHFRNTERLLRGLDTHYARESLAICLLTGKKSVCRRLFPDNRIFNESETDVRAEIGKGTIHIVIGTHALIQESVSFRNLGLVIIDEQHRFGVIQRAALRKKGVNPDVIVMTATPIPRTLALTLYGDLNYSLIDELPPLRQPVETKLYLDREKRLVYNEILKELNRKGQIFIVYPVIEEDEDSSLHSAMAGKESLEKIFRGARIGLIHGKMKPFERDQTMDDFQRGDVDILVSTTVIEVGIDVPNATLMIIVHAERFGLSQLHQLRGRVGRGRKKARCILIAYPPLSDEAERRLTTMVQTTDGFRVSEEDLNIRGPGEFLGTRQSGMPDLKVAHIIRDAYLLEIAKQESKRLVSSDPELSRFPLLRSEVNDFWKGKVDIFKTS